MNDAMEKILEFWFGTFPDAHSSDPKKVDMWFQNGADYDQEIFVSFGGIYDEAVSGALNHWLDMPRGKLALIIVLDQFSRHLHRGHAESFTQDIKAQEICVDGISAGDDSKLHPVERIFFYLPLEHAEDIERQELSVQAFAQLSQDVPESHQQPFKSSLDYAMQHHYVIEQFGRFPELNEILGRESTPEEIEFIESGEYSFL
jgi:uncharacterized protein (DUF924 family)